MNYAPYSMSDVMNSSSRRLFTVVSLFAGGGGSSIGYRLAGGDVRLVNEFIKEAGRTYSANFPDTIVDGRDLRRINWRKKPTEHTGILEFLGSAGLKVGELDILDGSPPCTEFSRAGRGLKDTWQMRKHSDSQQKGAGMLFYDYLYLVKRAKPKIFVAENVPDIATSKKNSALFADFVDASRYYRMRDQEKERAYYSNWAVLNAADFGVPQSRRRMFLIGVRKDVAKSMGIHSDEEVKSLFPNPTCHIVTVRDALDNLDQSDAEVKTWRLVTCH
jgi:DNA-cytosine methyltransferase